MRARKCSNEWQGHGVRHFLKERIINIHSTVSLWSACYVPGTGLQSDNGEQGIVPEYVGLSFAGFMVGKAGATTDVST